MTMRTGFKLWPTRASNVVSKEVAMSVVERVMVKSCMVAKERAKHIEMYEGARGKNRTT